MNPYYDNRLVKLISPINNEVFTLQLEGDETELKELIGAIINVSPTSIKGLRDCYGNYFTFSSAIHNSNLTSDYSSFYFIIISTQNLQSSPNPIKKKTSLLSLNAISPIRKNTKEPTHMESPNQNIIFQNSNDKFYQMADRLYEEKYIDDKQLSRIKQMLLDENDEIITLFSLSVKHGHDLKKLSKQIAPLLDTINKNGSAQIMPTVSKKGSRRGSTFQNLSMIGVLDTLEDQFESKTDISLLKKLIMCDNEQVIKSMEQYESDNDIKKLVDALNKILNKYRGRFSKPQNYFNPQTSILDLKVSESREEERHSIDFVKLLKKINTTLRNNGNIRGDYIEFFNYDMNNMDTNQKKTLLFEIFNLNTNNSEISTSFFNKFNNYYDNIIKQKIFDNLTKGQFEIYNNQIGLNDLELIELIKKNIKKGIEIMKIKVKEYIEKKENEDKDSEEEEEEEENESEEQQSSNGDDSESEEKEDDSNEYIINSKGKKEKSTHILRYNYKKKTTKSNQGFVLQHKATAQKETKPSNSKQESTSTSQIKESNRSSTIADKHLKDFIKVINKMAFSDSNKKDILDLLTNKDEKMLKIFNNYQKNKMSLTKKILLEALKSKTPNKVGDPFTLKIKTMLDQNEIDSKTYRFIIFRYNQKDEMLYSFWEVFNQDNDEDDFIDNIQIFIKKYQNLINQFEEE